MNLPLKNNLSHTTICINEPCNKNNFKSQAKAHKRVKSVIYYC